MIILAADGIGISRAVRRADGRWSTEHIATPGAAKSLVADPSSPQRAFAGTTDGVLRSENGGYTWTAAGLTGRDVRAIAVSPVQSHVVYAGTRPVGLYLSRDGGDSWSELAALRRVARRRAFFSPAEWPPIPYVSAIAPSAVFAGRIVVGFEVGGVVVSDDGGASWRVGRGAIYDCHSLAAHPRDGLRFYQGGAGMSKAGRTSIDGGLTWTGPRVADGQTYGWASAGDTETPNIWFYSASSSPMKAHTPGRAAASIYRVRGAGQAERLGGGLPDGIPNMPYQMLTRGDALYAGLANGDVWQSNSHGDSWEKLPVNLGRIERAMIVL
jgi:hypothetical protein